MALETSKASLNTLDGPDGSATYSGNGYTVIAAINGPIEVSRRDELPEEATLEVNIRPAVGVGGPRDRHLELLVHSTLSRIISTEAFPRSLIQLTLQVLGTPTTSDALLPEPFAQSLLPLLPALLNASLLSLISGAIPLSTTMTLALAVSIRGRKDPIILPAHGVRWEVGDDAQSNIIAVHVCAVTGDGQLALAESEGDFSYGDWEEVCLAAKAHSLAEESEMDTDRVSSRGRQWLLDLTKQDRADAVLGAA